MKPGPRIVVDFLIQTFFPKMNWGIGARREMKMAKTVLIIDDERDLCEVVSRALTKEGFEVDCAFNLAEAEQKLGAHRDIVIMDNNLPDGIGLEYIQKHPLEFMQSFVILITADPDKNLQEEASVVGINTFLSKPFSASRVKEILKYA